MPHFFEGYTFKPGCLVTCTYGTTDIERAFTRRIRPLKAGMVYQVVRLVTVEFNLEHIVVADAQRRTYPRFAGFHGDDSEAWLRDFDRSALGGLRPLRASHNPQWFEPFVTVDGAKRFFECLDTDYPVVEGWRA